MMHPQLLQASWPLYNIMNSTLDQAGPFGLNNHEFSPSITTGEDSPTNSSDSYFPTLLSEKFVEFPALEDEMQVMLPAESIDLSMDGFEAISSDEIEDMCKWLDESENQEIFSSHTSMEENDVWSPDLSIVSNDASEFLPSINKSIILPANDMEIDSQLSLCHLLKAYGEAMDQGQSLLAEVIAGCIKEKVGPVGETLERVAFNLFHPMENQRDYIKQESSKNFEAAFRAFYEIFPYGRFPHLAANLAILEAMPDDAEMMHIIDFDMGEGIQWPPIIEAIARQQKVLRLTSIKVESESGCNSSRFKFAEIKWRLHEYARSFGVRLKVEEMRLEDLVNSIEESNGREWLAFNCMANLPQMGRRRSRRDIMDFLKVAQVVLANSATYKGILACGHGEDGERMKNYSGYSSFLDKNLRHYQALYESMECSFPTHFAEARLAMESLFLTPYVSSSLSCFQRWEEIRDGPVFEEGAGLEGWRLSKENSMEASAMVKEGESLYTIKIEGQNQNEMILEWRGTPLVRVSTWMEIAENPHN